MQVSGRLLIAGALVCALQTWVAREAPAEPTAPAPPVPVPAKRPGTAATPDTPPKPPAPAVPPQPEKKHALVPAKELFGAQKSAAPLAARAIGSYARGCLAGAAPLAVDGPAWQRMRLSRNRQWGHPDLIKLIERFAGEARAQDGWNGLLVGDISQPRGGPMLSGHASHQVGLDADIWLTPMPDRKLTVREREDMSATSMLADKTAVDPKLWTPSHLRIIRRAASYPSVERVLVHPAIKKEICTTATGDRAWLAKVRPIWGHNYHFHIRIGCPANSAGCQPQVPPPGDDGCGKEIEDWMLRLTAPPPPPPKVPPKPSPPKPPMTLEQLPADCRIVLEGGAADLPPRAAPVTRPKLNGARRVAPAKTTAAAEQSPFAE